MLMFSVPTLQAANKTKKWTPKSSTRRLKLEPSCGRKTDGCCHGGQCLAAALTRGQINPYYGNVRFSEIPRNWAACMTRPHGRRESGIEGGAGTYEDCQYAHFLSLSFSLSPTCAVCTAEGDTATSPHWLTQACSL